MITHDKSRETRVRFPVEEHLRNDSSSSSKSSGAGSPASTNIFFDFFFVAIQTMSLNLRAVVVIGSCEEGGMISFCSGITAVLDQHMRGRVLSRWIFASSNLLDEKQRSTRDKGKP